MIILLFVVHVLIALALIAVVLLQKSEGGARGMGGGGMSGFMTGRSTANLLTRTTAFLAVAFFLTSLVLVWFSNTTTRAPTSIIDRGVFGRLQQRACNAAVAVTDPRHHLRDFGAVWLVRRQA